MSKLVRIRGDLLELAEAGVVHVLAHGCNCFHTMGAGFAKTLADKYPIVRKVDMMHTKRGDRNKLGTCTSALCKTDKKIEFFVVNAYTQYAYGTYTDNFEYAAFANFLVKFKEDLCASGEPIVVGFPMIGSGLAGGDATRITKMLEAFAESLPYRISVLLVEYSKA